MSGSKLFKNMFKLVYQFHFHVELMSFCSNRLDVQCAKIA